MSSNTNEVIRAVLNFLLFFYKKISDTPKTHRAQKVQKAQNRNQAKIQNTTSEQKQKKHLKII